MNDPLGERLIKIGFYHFYRGDIACQISKEDGHYFGHIGVSPSSQLFRSLFTKVMGVRLYHANIQLTGTKILDQRWWFGLPEPGVSANAVLNQLILVADKVATT